MEDYINKLRETISAYEKLTEIYKEKLVIYEKLVDNYQKQLENRNSKIAALEEYVELEESFKRTLLDKINQLENKLYYA